MDQRAQAAWTRSRKDGLDLDQAKEFALPHDAVEDQGGLPTLDTSRHLFGRRVADGVESCSDSTVSDPAKKLPWRERKEKYLAHLRSTKNEDALIVAAADKLHNARAILADYRENGETYTDDAIALIPRASLQDDTRW